MDEEAGAKGDSRAGAKETEAKDGCIAAIRAGVPRTTLVEGEGDGTGNDEGSRSSEGEPRGPAYGSLLSGL